jgi:uncharacterized protein (DUF302 family)
MHVISLIQKVNFGTNVPLYIYVVESEGVVQYVLIEEITKHAY